MGSNRGRRREEARARARRRRTATIAIVAVLAGVIAIPLVVRAVRDDRSSGDADATDRPRPSDERDGSVAIERDSALRMEPLDEYHVTYRVDDFAGGTKVSTTEDVRVRRPFDSRVERRKGEPPGDEETGVQLSRFGRLSMPAGDEGTLTLDVPPEIAGGDWRLDVSLDALARAGAVAVREWREVIERPCRVHRFGTALASADPVAYDPNGDEYADVCVDEAGIVLEEVWVTDGRVLRRRVAVEFTDAAALTDADLADSSDPLPPDQGGGSLEALDPESSPTTASWELATLPAGFARHGRYAVRAPQQPGAPGGVIGGATASLVDVWTSGADILLLEQGGAVGPSEDASPNPAVSRRDIPGVGIVEARLGLRMNEVRLAPPGQAGAVRVRGTLAVDELLEAASGLREVPPGTGLVPVDGP